MPLLRGKTITMSTNHRDIIICNKTEVPIFIISYYVAIEYTHTTDNNCLCVLIFDSNKWSIISRKEKKINDMQN